MTEMEANTYLSRSRYLFVCKAKLLDEAGRLGLGIVNYPRKILVGWSWLTHYCPGSKRHVCLCAISDFKESNEQTLSFAHLQLPSPRWKSFGEGYQKTKLSPTSFLDSGAKNMQASLLMLEKSSLAKLGCYQY